MGEAINHFFESKMQWFYDNGIFYISGRDISCVITGFILGMIIMIFVDYFVYNRKEK